MNRRRILGLIAILCLPAAAASQRKAAPPSHAGKLFVDVSAADYVEVVDLATRQVVDKIVVGQHPHGLVLGRHSVCGRQRNFLYVTTEESGELVTVDADTHDVVGRLHVGEVPNQPTLTRDGKFAYVPLRHEAKVAIVELGAASEFYAPGESGLQCGMANSRLLKTVPVGEWPHNAYTGETTGRIFVTSFRGKKIHAFDPVRHALLFEIEFPGEVRPIALTRDESRAYVAQSEFHGFLVADIAARKVIAKVELPALPPDTPEPYLKTYVHGLTLSPNETDLWVTSCPGAAVYVYSLPDLKLKAKIPTGKFPHWFAWETPRDRTSGKANGGSRLWVSQMDSNQVSLLDPADYKIIATVSTGPAPRRIVVAPGR